MRGKSRVWMSVRVAEAMEDSYGELDKTSRIEVMGSSRQAAIHCSPETRLASMMHWKECRLCTERERETRPTRTRSSSQVRASTSGKHLWSANDQSLDVWSIARFLQLGIE